MVHYYLKISLALFFVSKYLAFVVKYMEIDTETLEDSIFQKIPTKTVCKKKSCKEYAMSKLGGKLFYGSERDANLPVSIDGDESVFFGCNAFLMQILIFLH